MILVVDSGFSALRLLSTQCPWFPYHLACQPGGGREAHDTQADAGCLCSHGGCESSQIVNSHYEKAKSGLIRGDLGRLAICGFKTGRSDHSKD